MESSDEHYQTMDHIDESSLLLCLPPNVRDQVYTAACGLGGNNNTVIFVNLNQRKRYHARPGNPDRADFYTMSSLFLTCKIISQELTVKVYGTHHFYINYIDFMNLISLGRLSTLALRSLTKLTVHLNVNSCGLGQMCDKMLSWSSPEGRPDHDGRRIKPLKLGESGAILALEAWRKVWTEKIQPNLTDSAKLNLQFICDVGDVRTGVKAVQPLLDGPSGILAGCSIRLSRKTDTELQELVEATVYHTTSRDHPQITSAYSPKPHFRFFDLPAEIQRHVLSFTDLITPFQEVEWSPRIKGMRWRYRLPDSIRNVDPYDIHGHGIRDLRVRRAEKTSYRGCWEFTYPSGCYCRCFHSAHSSITRCKCWMPPTAMFLVNKAFHELAMETSYGSNRFIVTPGRGATWTKFCTQRPSPQIPASMFLQRTVLEKALPYLRSLELVFPPFGGGGPFHYCPPNSSPWQDWVQTLDYIKDKVTLESLTIRIIFAPWIPHNWSSLTGAITNSGHAWMEDEFYAEWLRKQKKSYMDVILPMRRLRGLRAFYAQLTFPSQCMEDWYQGYPVRLLELEAEAERAVMGWEYDAIAAGKYKVQDSIWMRTHRLTEIA